MRRAVGILAQQQGYQLFTREQLLGSTSVMEKEKQRDPSDVLELVTRLVQRHKLAEGQMSRSDKVVDFLHPAELERKFCLEIGKDGKTEQELEEIFEQVIQYSVKTTHPYFFNQLYHGVDEYSLAASWLSEALNTNNHTFEVAPVFIVVEQAALKYVRHLFGWGDEGDGIFCPGGSLANMYGMVLARHFRFPDIKTKGLAAHPPLVVFTSEESHYSIVKGAAWLGIGSENVIKVNTDSGGRMIPEDLEAGILEAKNQNRIPLMVNATAGSTVLGAYDDLDSLAEICYRHKVWLHVDACWGGAAILSPALKHLLKGSEKVDSVSWNPHKMLGASLQTSPFIVRHAGLLEKANSANASYLFQQDKFYDVSYDTGDKSIQCGRKTDAFKFWFMMKARGEAYLADAVDNAFNMAGLLQEEIEKREWFRLVPAFQNRQCTNVGFWYIPPTLRHQEENEAWWAAMEKVAPLIKEKMIVKGSLMIGYQPLPAKNFRNFFRMVVHCSPRPTPQDMIYVLDEIQRIGQEL